MSKNKKTKALSLIIIALVFTVAFASCENSDSKAYVISFNANGGSGTMADQTFFEGVPQNLNACTYTKEGYYFLGWAMDAAGTGIKYANGASFTISKNITLYAIWLENVVGLADMLAVAPTIKVGESLSFGTYYTLDVLDGTYHGQMLGVSTIKGNEYSISVSDTSVHGWILCKADGSISTYGSITDGKGKFEAEGTLSYLLIGFKSTPPGGSFTVNVNDYIGIPGESEKYAIPLLKGIQSENKQLESYKMVWYEITVPNDGKGYGLTINKIGSTGNNLVIYIFTKNSDGTSDRQNYKFAYAYENSSSSTFDNFAFPSGISASVGEGLTINSGTYYIVVLANEIGLSCSLLFDETV